MNLRSQPSSSARRSTEMVSSLWIRRSSQTPASSSPALWFARLPWPEPQSACRRVSAAIGSRVSNRQPRASAMYVPPPCAAISRAWSSSCCMSRAVRLMSAVLMVKGSKAGLTIGPAICRLEERLSPSRRVEGGIAVRCERTAGMTASPAEAMGLAAAELEGAGRIATERGEQAAQLGRGRVEHTDLSGELGTDRDRLDALEVLGG